MLSSLLVVIVTVPFCAAIDEQVQRQTGAMMTAMVVRAEGKLSREDEIEFFTHWGTEEALLEA